MLGAVIPRLRLARPIDALTLGVASVVHLPGLFIGPSLDAGVFGVVGWRMANGALPYRDVWDHKPPGIFLVNFLAAAAGELQWPVVWALSVLAVTAVAIATCHVVLAFAGGRIAAVAGAATAAVGGQYLLTLGGGLTEPFAAALAMVAFARALTARSTAAWALIGVVLGLSVLTSTQLAPAVAGVTAIALGRDGRWGRMAAMGLGLAVVAAATLVALAVSGTLAAAMDAVLSYNAAYRSSAGVDPRRWSLVPWTVLVTLPLVAPALVGALRLRAHPPAFTVGIGAVVWIVMAVAVILVQDRFYAHYAIGLVPPLAILAAVGLMDLHAHPPLRRGWLVPGAVLVLIGTISLPVSFLGAAQEGSSWLESNRRSDAVGAAIRDLASPQGTVLVWGNEPWLYRMADRTPTTRFVYMLPLVTPGYGSEELTGELRRTLEADPPQLVIDAGSPAPGEPGFPELLMNRPSATDGRDADPLDPIRAFINTRYSLLGIVEGWPIYGLSDSGS